MDIKQRLIPVSNKTTRLGISMNPTYITIHETDNPSKGADAAAHATLQANGNNRVASWHYSVDDTEMWQSIPDNEVSWACGDGGNGTGNRHSISVEICVNNDGNFEKAKANAIWLVQHLMSAHNIPSSHVVQHNKWSGKNCPRNLRISGWSEFIAAISRTNPPTTVTKPTGKPYPGNLIKSGAHGSSVKDIQRALGGLTIDGIYGSKTLAAVKQFQKAHQLTVDGIVGPKSWAALFK